MKLWLLKPVPHSDESLMSPWPHGYWDSYVGFVVRARDENEARRLAQEYAEATPGDETITYHRGNKVTLKTWEDSSWVDCSHLQCDGESGVILSDFIRS